MEGGGVTMLLRPYPQQRDAIGNLGQFANNFVSHGRAYILVALQL